LKQEEILAMMHNVIANNTHYTTWTVSTPHLVALVNQAVEAEREACAKLIDDFGTTLANGEMLAEAIRARNNQ
jgi:hypothetical protein